MRFVLLALLLVGCASVEPEKVPVAVPVSCIKSIPPAPDFPDTDAKLRVSNDRLKAVIAGRPLHFVYEAQLLAALEACK
jgi:hypothetical protein